MNQQQIEIEKKDRRVAAILSVLIFALIVVLTFFLTAFTIQDPPPGEQFVAVGMADFGSDLNAGGDNETEVPSEEVQEVVDQQTSQSETQNTAPTEEIVTQENSDVSVPTGTAEQTQDEPVEEQQEVSSGLSSVLDRINDSSGGGGSEGQNEGTGNEGDPQGQIDGMGVVQGDGIGYSLAGRGMLGRPKLGEDPKEEGTVVLNIYVDRNGNVTRTTWNRAQSTTTSSYLVELAKKAAKTAKFSVKNNAPAEQKGTMTFRFELK
jgi:TonB family protein